MMFQDFASEKSKYWDCMQTVYVLQHLNCIFSPFLTGFHYYLLREHMLDLQIIKSKMTKEIF